MLDGAPLFRIETVEIGGCRLHGVDGPCVKKSDSVIPLVVTTTSAFFGVKASPRNRCGRLTLTRRYEQIKNNPVLKTFDEGMSASVQPPAVLRLREQIQRLEGTPLRARAVLPFGVQAIDDRLPGGGLALGALHEVAGGGNAAIDGAAAALFAAGIAARTKGKVLWCITRQDLFAPALAQVGLAADRVIYVDACDEKSVLACFEEGVRHGGLGARRFVLNPATSIWSSSPWPPRQLERLPAPFSRHLSRRALSGHVGV